MTTTDAHSHLSIKKSWLEHCNKWLDQLYQLFLAQAGLQSLTNTIPLVLFIHTYIRFIHTIALYSMCICVLAHVCLHRRYPIYFCSDWGGLVDRSGQMWTLFDFLNWSVIVDNPLASWPWFKVITSISCGFPSMLWLRTHTICVKPCTWLCFLLLLRKIFEHVTKLQSDLHVHN